MKKFIDILTNEAKYAFRVCGYDDTDIRVTKSNRPDLCEYQCNGALLISKKYKQNPMDIAAKVEGVLSENDKFTSVSVAKPGFLNLNINKNLLLEYISEMNETEKFGYEIKDDIQTIVLDYGGANVAKPLHVGHLRTAVIGEALKRILKFCGHNVIGDVHLGDWGLQIGLIICQLKTEQPNLIYFDDSYSGDYPKEASFTISELEEIYPRASARSKEDEAFKEEARQAIYELQNGKKAYIAIWKHILDVSIEDLKRNYDRLDVHFDLWKKESDAQPYIADMVKYMNDGGYTRISDGALVVDVKTEEDTKEIPPCMILKSNGATLYNTTDLATIVERMKLFNPDRIIYVVDKRQELYFEQVFRCAKKTKLITENTKLDFLGFGTMNGKDGKPFKTRDGGVMRLQTLLDDTKANIVDKMKDAVDINIDETAEKIALSAIKYGDLSNQATKDYIFDLERFSSFDGETGPYILYTMVRIKSILAKSNFDNNFEIVDYIPEDCINLIRKLVEFNEIIENIEAEYAIHKLCKYVYEISNLFNTMYHSTRILGEEDEKLRVSYLSICLFTLKLMELCIDLLGFEAPDKM